MCVDSCAALCRVCCLRIIVYIVYECLVELCDCLSIICMVLYVFEFNVFPVCMYSWLWVYVCIAASSCAWLYECVHTTRFMFLYASICFVCLRYVLHYVVYTEIGIYGLWYSVLMHCKIVGVWCECALGMESIILCALCIINVIESIIYLVCLT